MKAVFTLMMSLSMLAMTSVFAYTGFGICNFGKETVPSVICYGPAVLKETTISGVTKVAGPLTAYNISADALTIAGSVDIENSKVNGTVDITGNVQAKDVEFQKDLTLTASDVSLTHTKVHGSITINGIGKVPYLRMQCNSAVLGTVVFVGKAGIIQITNDSVIQGKITNGAMEFVSKSCK